MNKKIPDPDEIDGTYGREYPRPGESGVCNNGHEVTVKGRETLEHQRVIGGRMVHYVDFKFKIVPPVNEMLGQGYSLGENTARNMIKEAIGWRPEGKYVRNSTEDGHYRAIFREQIQTKVSDASLDIEQSVQADGADTWEDAVSGQVTQAAEAMQQLSEQVTRNLTSVASQITEALDDIKLGLAENAELLLIDDGHRVIVENKDGSIVGGTFAGMTNQDASEATVRGEPLVDYWDGEIDGDEPVVAVKLNGGTYDYPACQVNVPITTVSGIGENKADALEAAGFSTYGSLVAASQQEIAEVEGIGNALAARIKADVGELPSDPSDLIDSAVTIECPECGDGFSVDSEEAIEGDEGELYCSLGCLNTSLLP